MEVAPETSSPPPDGGACRAVVIGTLVGGSGTSVPFPEVDLSFSLVNEQFWGRAARASGDSQESGRPFDFWVKLVASHGAEIQRPYFPTHSVWPSTRLCIASSTSCRLAPGLRFSFPLSA